MTAFWIMIGAAAAALSGDVRGSLICMTAVVGVKVMAQLLDRREALVGEYALSATLPVERESQRLDETVPGGLTRRADGTWQNANGEVVTTDYLARVLLNAQRRR